MFLKRSHRDLSITKKKNRDNILQNIFRENIHNTFWYFGGKIRNLKEKKSENQNLILPRLHFQNLEIPKLKNPNQNSKI